MTTSATSKPKIQVRRRPRGPLVIDFHTHIRVLPALEQARRLSHKGPAGSWKSAAQMAREDRAARDPRSKHTSAKTRKRDMDKMGVDIQVVSMNLPAACYAATGAEAQKIARATNDGIAEFITHDPDRFVGIGSVPMQDAKRAVKELDYAINSAGLKAVTILTHIGERELGDAKFEPFWTKAEELGAPVFIHPQGFTQPQRMQKHALSNTIGQPLEEALAMSSLIQEGVMDRHPKLKLGVAHGGGFMAFYPGRWDKAWQRQKTAKTASHKLAPSAYLKRFFYDTVVFDRLQLEHLVARMGANRVLLGSDYPWVPWDAVGFVKKTRSLSRETKDKILWKNAAQLLGLRV